MLFLGRPMNKSHLVLPWLVLAAGIVLFIAVVPLVPPGPKVPLAPQLAATVTQPTTPQAIPAPTPAKPTTQETFTAPAETFPEARRACILKAAEMLPRIPGLVIQQSRTQEMTRPARWTGSSPPIRVEVDIIAAGQSGTYAYLCGDSPAGAVVQRLAN
jgi:hypothetical protein